MYVDNTSVAGYCCAFSGSESVKSGATIYRRRAACPFLDMRLLHPLSAGCLSHTRPPARPPARSPVTQRNANEQTGVGFLPVLGRPSFAPLRRAGLRYRQRRSYLEGDILYLWIHDIQVYIYIAPLVLYDHWVGPTNYLDTALPTSLVVASMIGWYAYVYIYIADVYVLYVHTVGRVRYLPPLD